MYEHRVDKSRDTSTSVFFYMKDRIKTEDIKILYCPTEHMLADFFTEPLQGSLFERFRKVLMGHAHIYTLSDLSLVPTEERVGEGNETVKTERVTIGKNGQDNQSTGVSDDVTVRPASGWTVVTGRTRTQHGKTISTTKTKLGRKNAS